MVIIAQRNGKTGEWGFSSMFPYYFLPEHIPGVVFQNGRSGRENGEGDGSAEVDVRCQRWSWSTVAGGKWKRSPSLTAD